MPLIQTSVSATAAKIDGNQNIADSTRAAGNVVQWDSYLPADCVSAMVKMGWDKTT